ncbi:MAG: HEAT repeat domain-containing protein [Dehalococcoidia bacterium]
MSFETYVQELVDPARALVASKLASLSNMEPAEAALLADVWLDMEANRRRSLVQQLVDIAEDNIELNFDAAFLLALADEDAEVRRAAIAGLWEYEGRDLIDALLELLRSDSDAAVRAEAASALGRFILQAEFDVLRSTESERIEEALRLTFEDEDELAEVRGRALESIGARSEAWVEDLIDRAYDSPDRRLRLSAVHAMGRSCDAAWLPKLVTELESDDAEMRFEAAVACGSIGDDAATSYLVPLLHDEDAETQEAAIAAVGEIGGAEAREALQNIVEGADERVREAVDVALAGLEFADNPLGAQLKGLS